MSSTTPAPDSTISEKCALDEQPANGGPAVAVAKEQTLSTDEEQPPCPARTITGWALTRAWMLAFCISVNFLNLGVATPSAIVPTIRRSNPPIPVLDNTYFLAFCVIMNSLNYLDEVVGHVREDRTISSVLLVSAALAATAAATAGATAPEVLMVFIPMGINVGLTAVSFARKPTAPRAKEMV